VSCTIFREFFTNLDAWMYNQTSALPVSPQLLVHP
jgi:hypothetical protein